MGYRKVDFAPRKNNAINYHCVCIILYDDYNYHPISVCHNQYPVLSTFMTYLRSCGKMWYG